jgi:hypothetical protein
MLLLEIYFEIGVEAAGRCLGVPCIAPSFVVAQYAPLLDCYLWYTELIETPA